MKPTTAPNLSNDSEYAYFMFGFYAGKAMAHRNDLVCRDLPEWKVPLVQRFAREAAAQAREWWAKILKKGGA